MGGKREEGIEEKGINFKVCVWLTEHIFCKVKYFHLFSDHIPVILYYMKNSMNTIISSKIRT